MSIAPLLALLHKILLRLRQPRPPATERIITRWNPLLDE